MFFVWVRNLVSQINEQEQIFLDVHSTQIDCVAYSGSL